MQISSESLVVGLDIGTHKVCAVVAERDESGLLTVTGIGRSPSRGMRRGVVVNIESVLNSIADAIEAAELMVGREVHSCWLGIGGASIESKISRGVVAVNGKNREQREISKFDIERVLEAARAVDFPMDREILDVIPQSYIVDSQSGVRNPLDMIGVRLESEVNIITCSTTSAQNLIKCVNRAGYHVEGLVLQPLAAGSACLTDEEKEIGVILIDMGGGKTDTLIFNSGAAGLTFSIPVGGSEVTNDISIVKNLSVETAEKIKVEAGCCWMPLIEGADEEIIAPGVGSRAPVPLTRSEVTEIIEPRMRETFLLVKERLDDYNVKSAGGGIVLTGGAANMDGAAELAQAVFNMPVRIGQPICPSAAPLMEEYRNPQFATAIGLVIEGGKRDNFLPESAGVGSGGGMPNIFGKFTNWVKTEFF